MSTTTVQEINKGAYEVYEKALWAAIRSEITNEEWLETEYAFTPTIEAALAVAEEGMTIYTHDGPLKVAKIDGKHMMLTEDGGPAIIEWHDREDGPTTGESVRYERFENKLRVAHGYIDPTTRKIVQVG